MISLGMILIGSEVESTFTQIQLNLIGDLLKENYKVQDKFYSFERIIIDINKIYW